MILLLKKYGDFDIPVVDSVWHSENHNNLMETGLTNSDFENDRETDTVKKRLKELGFKEIKTNSLTIGGNL